MIKCILYVVCAILLFVTQACQTMYINSTCAVEKPHKVKHENVKKAKQVHLIFGLVRINTTKKPNSQFCSVSIKKNVIDSFVGLITMGFVQLRTITYLSCTTTPTTTPISTDSTRNSSSRNTDNWHNRTVPLSDAELLKRKEFWRKFFPTPKRE